MINLADQSRLYNAHRNNPKLCYIVVLVLLESPISLELSRLPRADDFIKNDFLSFHLCNSLNAPKPTKKIKNEK